MFNSNYGAYQPYPSYGGYQQSMQQRGQMANMQPPIPMQQPQAQMQTQSPMTQQTPQIQELRYGTEEEAKAFIVFPNCIAYFIDYPKNRMYAKSANQSGISNIEYFSLTPINADGSPIEPKEPIPQVNFDEFVKKDQIDSMGFVTNAQYETLLQKLEAMQKQINSGGRANGTKQSN